MVSNLVIAAAGILFDMDGTLVDSTAVVESVWSKLADERDLDTAVLIPFSHGRPTIDTLRHFLPDLPDAQLDGLERVFTAEEVRRTDGIVEVPGAAVLLDRLLAVGAPVALVTSASVELADSRMAAAGLPMPAVLVTADDVACGKPAPEGYLCAAELLGVPIESCVVFEDAEAGVLAACASGAQVVVVGPHESPTTEGLARVADLSDIVVESNGPGLRIRL